MSIVQKSLFLLTTLLDTTTNNWTLSSSLGCHFFFEFLLFFHLLLEGKIFII